MPSGKNKRKYSPIREAEDEEAQSLKNSSKGGSKKGGGASSSGDNYSSYRYDESESVRGKTSA